MQGLGGGGQMEGKLASVIGSTIEKKVIDISVCKFCLEMTTLLLVSPEKDLYLF